MDNKRILSILLLSCFLFLFLSPGTLLSPISSVILDFYYYIHCSYLFSVQTFFFLKGFGVETMGTMEQAASLTPHEKVIIQILLSFYFRFWFILIHKLSFWIIVLIDISFFYHVKIKNEGFKNRETKMK